MPQNSVARFVSLSLAVLFSFSSLSTAQAPSDRRDVIVILRDQVAGMPAQPGMRRSRAAALAAAQSPVIGPLQQTRLRRVKAFRTINAFATSVSGAEAVQLAANPQVLAVIPDAVIRQQRPLLNVAGDLGGAPSAGVTTSGGGGLCNTLEPEALQLTNAAFADPKVPQAQLVLDANGHPVTGRGVKVAFLADGLDTTDPGFIRPDGSSVFIDYQDFSGDPAGTPTEGGEAFGDASSIAAQDMPNGVPLLYDISQFVNASHPLPSPCNIRIRGIAPGASLVGLKVFSNLGYTTTSSFVQAIEWAVVEDEVDVINESFGGNPFFDSGTDPISLANKMAVQAGVTVVASTGDAGSAGTLGSPSTDPYVIGAGASTQFRSYAQTAYGVQPLANGYVSNNISSLSSGGFAQKTPRTVDVVAPGDLGWALCSPNVLLYTDCTSYMFVGSPIQVFGGTSESSPLTAGEAALVIQAYRSTHHAASPSPDLIKRIIMSTASDLGAPSDEQGAGLINALAAVNTALSSDDSDSNQHRAGDGLLISQTSAQFVDEPSSRQSESFTIENTGSTTRRLEPHLQKLGAPTAGATLTLPLAPGSDPTFTYVNGALRSYITQTFKVSAGAQHLDAAIAYKTSSPGSSNLLVWLALLDPSGRQAAYSLPQGSGNGYGHVDVVAPMAGTWTAIVFTRVSGATSYSGPVQFTWSTEQFVSFGSVSPALVDIAPGATRTITADFTMPSNPGDTAAALRFDASADRGMAEPEIPVTLRTLVSLHGNGGDFTGTLTGGNGRSGAGPTQTYQFDVPVGTQNLNVALNLADNGYLLEGLLVDPHGMQLSVQPNLDPVTGQPLYGMQLYHEHPQAGRWSFVLLLNFTASGNQTSLPFTAHIGLSTVPYTVTGLPDDPKTKVSAGTPLTVPITVTNNSAVTQVFFADARLKSRAITSLPIFLCSNSPVLPGLCYYTYVPPEANDIQFLAQSTVPITMDAFNSMGYNVGFTGSPDLYAHSIGPDTVEAALRTHDVPWGFWLITPSLVGPYGPAGAQPAPVQPGAAVNMRPFDPGVVADTGNFYSDQVYGTSTFNPLVLAPGASGVIHLTIQPSASQLGQTVEGIVFLDSFNNVIFGGDEVVRIPYTYTVGR